MTKLDIKTLKKFIRAVLDDDQGINETAYLILQVIITEHPELQEIGNAIHETNGRYYLDSNWIEE